LSEKPECCASCECFARLGTPAGLDAPPAQYLPL